MALPFISDQKSFIVVGVKSDFSVSVSIFLKIKDQTSKWTKCLTKILFYGNGKKTNQRLGRIAKANLQPTSMYLQSTLMATLLASVNKKKSVQNSIMIMCGFDEYFF